MNLISSDSETEQPPAPPPAADHAPAPAASAVAAGVQPDSDAAVVPAESAPALAADEHSAAHAAAAAAQTRALATHAQNPPATAEQHTTGGSGTTDSPSWLRGDESHSEPQEQVACADSRGNRSSGPSTAELVQLHMQGKSLPASQAAEPAEHAAAQAVPALPQGAKSKVAGPDAGSAHDVSTEGSAAQERDGNAVHAGNAEAAACGATQAGNVQMSSEQNAAEHVGMRNAPSDIAVPDMPDHKHTECNVEASQHATQAFTSNSNQAVPADDAQEQIAPVDNVKQELQHLVEENAACCADRDAATRAAQPVGNASKAASQCATDYIVPASVDNGAPVCPAGNDGAAALDSPAAQCAPDDSAAGNVAGATSDVSAEQVQHAGKENQYDNTTGVMQLAANAHVQERDSMLQPVDVGKPLSHEHTEAAPAKARAAEPADAQASHSLHTCGQATKHASEGFFGAQLSLSSAAQGHDRAAPIAQPEGLRQVAVGDQHRHAGAIEASLEQQNAKPGAATAVHSAPLIVAGQAHSTELQSSAMLASKQDMPDTACILPMHVALDGAEDAGKVQHGSKSTRQDAAHVHDDAAAELPIADNGPDVPTAQAAGDADGTASASGASERAAVAQLPDAAGCKLQCNDGDTADASKAAGAAVEHEGAGMSSPSREPGDAGYTAAGAEAASGAADTALMSAADGCASEAAAVARGAALEHRSPSDAAIDGTVVKGKQAVGVNDTDMAESADDDSDAEAGTGEGGSDESAGDDSEVDDADGSAEDGSDESDDEQPSEQPSTPSEIRAERAKEQLAAQRGWHTLYSPAAMYASPQAAAAGYAGPYASSYAAAHASPGAVPSSDLPAGQTAAPHCPPDLWWTHHAAVVQPSNNAAKASAGPALSAQQTPPAAGGDGLPEADDAPPGIDGDADVDAGIEASAAATAPKAEGVAGTDKACVAQGLPDSQQGVHVVQPAGDVASLSADAKQTRAQPSLIASLVQAAFDAAVTAAADAAPRAQAGDAADAQTGAMQHQHVESATAESAAEAAAEQTADVAAVAEPAGMTAPEQQAKAVSYALQKAQLESLAAQGAANASEPVPAASSAQHLQSTNEQAELDPNASQTQAGVWQHDPALAMSPPQHMQYGPWQPAAYHQSPEAAQATLMYQRHLLGLPPLAKTQQSGKQPSKKLQEMKAHAAAAEQQRVEAERQQQLAKKRTAGGLGAAALVAAKRKQKDEERQRARFAEQKRVKQQGAAQAANSTVSAAVAGAAADMTTPDASTAAGAVQKPELALRGGAKPTWRGEFAAAAGEVDAEKRPTARAVASKAFGQVGSGELIAGDDAAHAAQKQAAADTPGVRRFYMDSNERGSQSTAHGLAADGGVCGAVSDKRADTGAQRSATIATGHEAHSQRWAGPRSPIRDGDYKGSPTRKRSPAVQRGDNDVRSPQGKRDVHGRDAAQQRPHSHDCGTSRHQHNRDLRDLRARDASRERSQDRSGSAQRADPSGRSPPVRRRVSPPRGGYAHLEDRRALAERRRNLREGYIAALEAPLRGLNAGWRVVLDQDDVRASARALEPGFLRSRNELWQRRSASKGSAGVGGCMQRSRSREGCERPLSSPRNVRVERQARDRSPVRNRGGAPAERAPSAPQSSAERDGKQPAQAKHGLYRPVGASTSAPAAVPTRPLPADAAAGAPPPPPADAAAGLPRAPTYQHAEPQTLVQAVDDDGAGSTAQQHAGNGASEQQDQTGAEDLATQPAAQQPQPTDGGHGADADKEETVELSVEVLLAFLQQALSRFDVMAAELQRRMAAMAASGTEQEGIDMVQDFLGAPPINICPAGVCSLLSIFGCFFCASAACSAVLPFA